MEEKIEKALDNRKKADVICQHSRDGKIIPMKLRVEDEDGQFQTFLIKSYKDMTTYGSYQMPNGVIARNHIFSFVCKIDLFNKQHQLQLYYNAMDNVWTVVTEGT